MGASATPLLLNGKLNAPKDGAVFLPASSAGEAGRLRAGSAVSDASPGSRIIRTVTPTPSCCPPTGLTRAPEFSSCPTSLPPCF